mgnify:CR=1 FL=1
MHLFSGPYNASVESTSALSLNTWWHLSFVFERNSMYLYKNGVLLAARTSVPQARNIIRNKSFIGKGNWGGDEDFIGVMDDLRIYHKALTANEIMQVMYEQD